MSRLYHFLLITATTLSEYYLTEALMYFPNMVIINPMCGRSDTMKVIEVVAAILMNDNLVLATKRGYGKYIDLWEFPGGKLEPGETKEEALHREIREELLIEIAIQDLFCTVDYDYPDFHLTMHCYICRVISGTITLLEHKESRWLSAEELNSVQWLPADIDIIHRLKNSDLL